MSWAITLAGHQFDLEDWREMFSQPFDPEVKTLNVPDGNGGTTRTYALFSSEFASCENSVEAWEASVVLLRRLNALAWIERKCEPVVAESVVEVQPDASILRHLRLAAGSGRSRSRAAAVGMAIHGASGRPIIQEPMPSFPQRALRTASEELVDGLEHLSRADNWHDLYKALETIEVHCGGRKKVGARCHLDQRDIEDIAQCANLVRHDKRKTAARPSQTWKLEEAKVFVGRLFRALL